MKLLIDIGNTRISWAFDSGTELSSPGAHMHRGQTPSAAMAFLDELAHAPTAAAAVNVAGAALEETLSDALAARFGIALQVCRATERCGPVVNGYREAGQLGADRWAAIVGAWQHCRSDVLAVDAGTALTVDLVRADGQHLGGLIVPGLHLMQAALGDDTADIARFAARGVDLVDADWFGRDTRSAVTRGAAFSLRALIHAAVAEFPGGRNAPPRLLLTGGDAPALASQLSGQVEVRPMLVLEGLRYLAAAVR